ncbi:TM0106 family RecB-like putative nuclease [Williamsia deligens]|uniref:TM0106 family RecB-like putative nuclease n=1 Tax=Williamsia deligens TaxID=321325 RepID=A0ABW3G3X7_9NOCA|nr:TM0106 family RecB-like putative nuclease [Williamsia deligens]
MLTARDLAGCEHRLALDAGVVPDSPLPGVGEPSDDAVVPVEDPSATRRKEAAALHRRRVAEMLRESHPGNPDAVVTVVGDTAAARVAATLAACAAGASWVLDAVLPDDRAAGRRGSSEALVRVDDGYVPVIVVNHRITVADTDGTAMTSPLGEWSPARDVTRSVRRHRRDVLRVAHLTRLLEHAGLASSERRAGVIGLDADCILVHDLAATAASGGVGPRDPLADYDATLAVRRAVAAGTVVTTPSRIGECRSCRWWGRCGPELVAAHDISLVATGNQTAVLRVAGITTVDDLARGDVPEPVVAEFPGGDVGDAVVVARAWLAGVPLVRRVERPAVVRADVEVDVDMESHGEDGAYLWGTLLTDRTDPSVPVVYRPFATWDPLPTTDEGRSFAEFWSWLTARREETVAAGKTFAAYCYSQSAENRWLIGSARRFAGMPGVPALDDVTAFIGSQHWVDVYEAVGAGFICPQGKGLKKIAPVAGFSWRDPDAGGEASMEWYRLAVGYEGTVPDTASRERILRYNEDDVWATKVLREWIDERAASAVPHRDDLHA